VAGFARNFIRTAVCELRFPTLLELDAVVPAFQRQIRREYPHYERNTDVNLDPSGVTSSPAHLFRSKDRRWVLSLRQSALVFETSSYTGFPKFAEALTAVLRAALPVLDTDFYTRLGMRYINVLDFATHKLSLETLSDWINPMLAGPLSSGALGDVDQAGHEYRGRTEEGVFILKHGLVRDGARMGYALDLDFAVEDLEVDKAIEVLARLHQREFDLFVWCLGPRAVQWLEGRSV